MLQLLFEPEVGIWYLAFLSWGQFLAGWSKNLSLPDLFLHQPFLSEQRFASRSWSWGFEHPKGGSIWVSGGCGRVRTVNAVVPCSQGSPRGCGGGEVCRGFAVEQVDLRAELCRAGLEPAQAHLLRGSPGAALLPPASGDIEPWWLSFAHLHRDAGVTGVLDAAV